MTRIESVRPVIPIDYYLDSLKKLNSMGVKFITYDDLPFACSALVEQGYVQRVHYLVLKTNQTYIVCD